MERRRGALSGYPGHGLPAAWPPELRLRRTRGRSWYRLDPAHPDDWGWAAFPLPRWRFDSPTGAYRVRYAASSARAMLREVFDPDRHIAAAQLGRWVVELVETGGSVLDLRTDDTLDALGLDDQVSTSRAPDVWRTAQQLGDLVWRRHERGRRPVPAIVYRSRTTPQHNASLAFFAHTRLEVLAARPLREHPALLDAAIIADGFSVG